MVIDRRRSVGAGALAVALLLLVAAAYVPRTIATGGVIAAEDGEILDSGWEVRAAPGIIRPRMTIRTATDEAQVRWDGLPPASIDDTQIVVVDGLVQPVTAVVGPTPWRSGSVRHDTEERIPGEAVITRLLWRRVHVAVLPGELQVREVTAIDRGGAIIDTALRPVVADDDTDRDTDHDTGQDTDDDAGDGD